MSCVCWPLSQVLTPTSPSTAIVGDGYQGYVKFNNLRGDVAYQFRVRARNSFGWGNWSPYSAALYVLGGVFV